MDEEGRAEGVEDRRSLARLLGGVRGDAGVQRLALPHGGVERAHRLLERRVGVEAVRVEDVDVVEAEAVEALVEAGEEVLARAAVTVGAGPHVVAGFRGDDELVAERLQVVAQESAEVLFRGAVRRPVVVGQVEVGHSEVEGATHDRAARLERPVVAEVPPESERDRRQLEAAAAAAAVAHAVVAVGCGHVAVDHRPILRRPALVTGSDPWGLTLSGRAPTVIGSGLEVDVEVIQLSAFRSEDGGRGAFGRIARPSRRH